MKKLKIALFLVVLAFAGLAVYQNMAYLLLPADLQLNLWVAGPYSLNGVKNAQLILAAFFAGLLIAYFFGLSFRFKTNKIVKNLNATVNSHVDTISSLKSELTKVQDAPPQSEPPKPEGAADNP
jgi:hypothetical protein